MGGETFVKVIAWYIGPLETEIWSEDFRTALYFVHCINQNSKDPVE